MKAKELFEKDASSLKDGGFIFQAIISHNLSFDIKEGYVVVSASTTYPFDKSRINAKLHQVDLFPDLRTESGTAALTYVVLSEVNNLARKFELAAEVVKRNLINPSIEVEKDSAKVEIPEEETDKVNVHVINRPKLEQGKTKTVIDITPEQETNNPRLGSNASALNPSDEKKALTPPTGPIQEAAKRANKVTIFYKDEVERLEKEGRLTRNEIKRLNALFFKNTSYTVTLSTEKLHLREISTSGLDSGSPEVVLKISTSLKDEAFGGKVPSFENFKLVVSGLASITLRGSEVANLEIFDPVEKKNDKIFQTILPSLILSFKTDQVSVETFTNKSSEIAARQSVTYKDLFEFDIAEEEESAKEKKTGPEAKEPEYTDYEEVKESLIRKIDNIELYQLTREAQHQIDEIKNRLNSIEKAYSILGESIYVKQEIKLLEKELESFYQQFDFVK